MLDWISNSPRDPLRGGPELPEATAAENETDLRLGGSGAAGALAVAGAVGAASGHGGGAIA